MKGVYLWCYNICKRKLWFKLKESIFFNKISYERRDKEFYFGDERVDIILETKNQFLIGKNVNNCEYIKAYKWQLMFYIKVLKDNGIRAKGVLIYPHDKKRLEVILDEESEKELELMIKDIERISKLKEAPKKEEVDYCKECMYYKNCFN